MEFSPSFLPALPVGGLFEDNGMTPPKSKPNHYYGSGRMLNNLRKPARFQTHTVQSNPVLPFFCCFLFKAPSLFRFIPKLHCIPFLLVPIIIISVVRHTLSSCQKIEKLFSPRRGRILLAANSFQLYFRSRIKFSKRKREDVIMRIPILLPPFRLYLARPHVRV